MSCKKILNKKVGEKMEVLNINSKRESLLYPLIEWKILGGQELGELSNYHGTQRGLRKMIERSEKDGLLKSFIHKLSNRKFVYLSRLAHREMTNDNWNINEEIKMHDAIVSSILYKLSLESFIKLTKINHQDIKFNESMFSHGIDPDGMIRANKNDSTFNIAIEVELTRKNSTEIFRKFKNYNENTAFTWVIYFFSSRHVLNAYFKYYKIFLEENQIEIQQAQIMFCHSNDLASFNLNPLNNYWLRPDGVNSTLKEFFL